MMGSLSRKATCALPLLVAAAILLALAGKLPAQGEYELSEGQWLPLSPPAEGTPAGELALIRQHLRQGRPGKALKAAKKFLKRYPDDPAQEEALLLAGEAELDRGRYYQAFERFDQQLGEFPAGRFFNRAIDREYQIAEAFLAGKKRILLGFFRLPAREEGLSILMRIAEHAPGSPAAEKALLRIADYHFQRREHAEAIGAYDTFLAIFGNSANAAHAMLRAAEATYASFVGVAFDITPLLDAEQRYRALAERFPITADSAGVGQRLLEIDETRAQKTFRTAGFYGRIGRDGPARFYYHMVGRQYSQTTWAELADQALAAMSPPTSPPGEPPIEPMRLEKLLEPKTEGGQQP